MNKLLLGIVILVFIAIMLFAPAMDLKLLLKTMFWAGCIFIGIWCVAEGIEEMRKHDR